MTTPTTPAVALEDQRWSELRTAFEQYMRQVLLGAGYFTTAGARRHAVQLADELLSITRQTLAGEPS